MDLSLGFCLLCTILLVHGQSDVRLPPSIILQNEETHVYLAITSKFILICDADGVPDPQYEWYQDGDIWRFDPGDVTPTLGSGNMTINEFSHIHAGEYQCMAYNKYGKTMSRKIKLEIAFIAKFDQTDPQSITKTEGEPLKLSCAVPKSAPQPTLSWKPVESLDANPQSITITMTRRVQMDDKGYLVFAYVLKEDEINDWYYRCFAENTIAGLSAFGSYAQLKVTGSSSGNVRPSIQSYTGQDTQDGIVTALKRQSVSLRCLFASKPEASVAWKRKDNKPLPLDRVDYEQFETVLIINDVEDYDEAVYICTGSNSAGSTSHEINVQVEAIPIFVDDKSKPQNTNSTDGEDAVFRCTTDAEPVADIKWYANSEEILDGALPDRVSIEDNRNTLRVSSVCKDCKNGGTDLKVYACEAINKHGSSFSSGYLNVLLPTVITTLPVSHNLTLQEREVTFTCEGITDMSTPLTVQWLMDGHRINYITEEIYPVDSSTGSTLHINTRDLEHSGEEYIGNFTCVLSNGYSSVNASAALIEVPGAVPVKAGSVADLWWVFLIVGILLLLLLLLLCCCICLQKNKGDSYPVDEKERANGNDPEKEMLANGFHDYQRPEDEPVKGSRASLSSAMKMDDSDDDGSLAQYGDIDAGNFNEDGSFIGLYQTGDRRKGDTNV